MDLILFVSLNKLGRSLRDYYYNFVLISKFIFSVFLKNYYANATQSVLHRVCGYDLIHKHIQRQFPVATNDILNNCV